MEKEKKTYFCQDCILKEMGRAMSEAEWIQHLSANPTHGAAIDETSEEQDDFENMVKS